MLKKILFLLFPFTLCAQTPATQWAKVFGGSHHDYSTCVRQTSDGGFVMAGQTYSIDGDVASNHGDGDAWIVKLDAAGNIEWEKNYGGSSTDSFRSIIQVPDGGYIAVGSAASIDGDLPFQEDQETRYWIVKVNAVGNIVWQKRYGGSSIDNGFDIMPCPGGFITVGATRSSDGDVTGFHGGTDIWAVRIDVEGNIIWQKALGGSSVDVPYSIKPTADDGFIISGYTSSSDGDITDFKGVNDMWVVKLDQNGTLDWQRTFGSTGNDGAAGIVQTADAGYLLCAASDITVANGDISQVLGGGDGWLFKLDADGNVQWKKPFEGSNADAVRDIQGMQDNTFVVAGHSLSTDNQVTENFGMFDAWVFKCDADGNIIWQKSYGGAQQDYPMMIQTTSDNGIIFVNRTLSTNLPNYHGYDDIWLVKLEGSLGIPDFTDKSFAIYPNPAINTFNISTDQNFDYFEIADANGRKIDTYRKQEEFDISTFATGVYIINAYLDGKSHSKKIIKK